MWDDKIKGFGVRVFPSGKKSFLVTYRNATNTKRFYTIGNYPDLTLEQARKLAKQKLLEVSSGEDPQATRKNRKAEMTFAELAEQYLAYSKEHKRSFRSDSQRLRDHILPVFGKRKLSEITLARLQHHMAQLCETLSPSTVNRCIALVKHIYTMAQRWQIVESSPAKHLQQYKEPPPCDVVLTPDQCQRILRACDEEENHYAAALFKLALLTGRRIGEIRTIMWKDVNIYHDDSGAERVRITIPQTKAGEQQYVFLNDHARAVLSAIERIVGNPYVIAGSAPGKPLQTYAKAWRRILAKAEVPYIKPHGLRHTRVALTAVAGGSAHPVARWIESNKDAEPIGSHYRSTRQAIGVLKINNNSPKIEIHQVNDHRFDAQGQDGVYIPLRINPMPTPNPSIRDSLNHFTQNTLLWTALHLTGNNRRILISIAVRPERTMGWYAEAFNLPGWEEVPKFSPPNKGSDAALFEEARDVCIDYCGIDSYEVQLLNRGIATNHGQMPQRLRRMMVALIERSICPITLATATLTEGVTGFTLLVLKQHFTKLYL
jgi:integrase